MTAEEIALVQAWAEELGDPELLTAVSLLGGLDLKLLLGDAAGGDNLLEQAARPEGGPIPGQALLFLALEARGQRLAELAALLQEDADLALALGSVLLLDRSDPLTAAAVLGKAALIPRQGPELHGRLYEYALLAAEAHGELVDLLQRRPPPGFASPAVRLAEALWRAGLPAARQAFSRLVEESFDSYARARLEELLEADGDFRALAELYRLALERTPSPQDRSLILLRLGEIHEEHLGEPEIAARLYAQAEGGRLSAAMTARRRALLRRSKDWEAYADCLREEARHIDDRRRAAALNQIAGRTLLQAVGDPLEAARAFREAMQLHPEDQRSRELLAEALLLAGDTEGLADLHEGPLAALLRRDPREMSPLPPPVQAVAAWHAGDWEPLAEACRRWSELEERPLLRAMLLTLAAQLDPDRGRARLDASAALFVADGYLPALLTLARLSVLEGRLRPAMESLARAAELTGNGQIRMILLLEAAEIGSGLGDPAAVAVQHRVAATTLFGGSSLPLDAQSLAEVLGEGGAWAQHAAPILREARRAGYHETLAPVLLELARPGTGKIAEEALRMAIEILPDRSELREPLLEILEGRGRWEEAVALLERVARQSLDPAHKVELLGRVAMIARGPLGDNDRANRALQRAEVAASTPAAALSAPPPPAEGGEQPPPTAEPEPAESLLAQVEQTTDWDMAINLLLMAGERLRRQGQLARAEEAYLQVLAREAAEPRALAALAALARQTGDWQDARQWLARLSEVENDREARLDIFLLRARIALEQEKDRAAAARDFEACLVLDPRCPEALAALESYYRDSGDWDALRLLYLQGLEGVTGQALAAGGEKLERTIDVLVSLAELEVAPLGHPERAIVHLKRALSLKPGDVGLLRRLADAAGRGRQWREKVEALETLARQVRDAGERANLYLEIAAIYRDHLGGGGVVLENTMVAFVCDNANRRAFEELERLYAAERRWREMIGIYDVALGTFPQGGPYQRDYLLKRKGLVLARAMDAPREASEVLLAALAISPEDSEVVGALELLLAQSHDAAHRLRMLEILADNREGVSRMELLLRAAEVSASLPGREKTNETYYRQALQAMPGVDERPVRALETIYRQSQRWEELLGLYDEVIRRSSEPGQRRFFLLRRAELLEAEQRDLGRAAAAYQQLLEEQEEDLEALAALARLYEASRSWDELLAVSRRQLARTRVPRDRGLLLFRIGSILETHRNDENGAEEAYRAALGEDPRCFPALHGLRDLYLRRQSWSRAVETLELEAGLWEDPRDQAAVLVRLGDLLHQRLAERKRAVAAYQQALRIAPGFPAAVRALLPLLIEIESWEEAGPLARQATRLAAVGAQADPATRLMALSQRALVALRLGELGEAAAALQLALQIDPQYFPALEVLRELALQPRCQQLPGETLQGLLAAVERSPAGAASAGLWLPVLRGRVAEARFEIEDALRQYRVASRAVPGSLEVCRPLISLLVRLRRWPEAADLLTALAEQAVERLDWAQTLLRQGQILMDRLDDAETAAACFARVIEELGSLRAADSEEGYGVGEERSWRVALFLGAQAAYLLQRWQEGSALLRRLVEAESEDPRNLHGPASLGLYHYYLGRFLRDGLDRTDEAAASFYQAIQEGPGLVEPVLALARQLWREGDRAELEELLDGQIALARTQSGPEAPLRLRYLLAQCRMRSGDSAAALSLLERAIREGEDPAMARRSLARLALAAGQVERAGEALRDVLLCGGSVVQTLKELVGIWEEQNDRPRLACLRPLLIAATGRSEVAPPPAGPGDLAAHPLPADLLRKNAVHPHARGLLFELWPELVHQLALQPGQERPPLEPLGTEHELIRACAEHLAARLGLPAPPLARLGQLGRPVAVLGDTLLIDAELARLQDAGALTFWLAGALFLKQAGLALAAHPRPEVAQQASRACAAVVVEAAGLAVPARWSLQPAPRCAVESAERALAAARQHSTAHSSIALPDPSRFLEGLELTCHRVGLLAVNDPAVALRELRRVQPGHPGGEVPRGEPRAILELIHYAVGGDHLEVCTQLGLAPSAHDARFEGRATKGGKPTMNEDDA